MDPPLGHQASWVNGRAHATISLCFVVLDLILLVGAAVWTVTTSVLGHPLIGQAEFAIFFVPMFVVFGYAVATRRGIRGPTGRQGNLSPQLPPEADSETPIGGSWPVLAIGGLAGLTVLTASIATGTLFPPSGQPMYESARHRYVLDDHGSLTTITKSAYEHGSIAGGHFFTAGACVFLLVALPMHLHRWRRWRESISSRDA